jgi:hypothetical protein
MTLRTRLLVIGAIRGAVGRQQLLRLGLRGHWRQRFAALLQRIAALAVSTVAQFTNHQKILRPSPGNRVSPASNQTYFQRSHDVFGLNSTNCIRNAHEAACKLPAFLAEHFGFNPFRYDR